jgi:hypothetical protein
MSSATRQFVWIMRFFSLIYLSVGSLFFFRPAFIFDLINIGPKNLNFYTEIPYSTESFWLVLTASMMSMLCLLSICSSLYPKNKSYIFIHVVAKTVSVTGFIYCFLTQTQYFAYIVGAITDTWVALVVGLFFLRSLFSAPPLDAPFETAEGTSSATG